MINPFQQIPGVVPNNPAMEQMGQLFGMAQALQNPQAAVIDQMMGNNEQLQQVMQYIGQHGNDAQAAFYAYAKENGIDSSQVDNALNQAKQMINQMTGR